MMGFNLIPGTAQTNRVLPQRCGLDCPCDLCKAYKLAVKDCGTPPDTVADFLIMFGNAIKENSVFSSYMWVFTDLCRNYLKERGLLEHTPK